jgi:hypothetical protein
MVYPGYSAQLAVKKVHGSAELWPLIRARSRSAGVSQSPSSPPFWALNAERNEESPESQALQCFRNSGVCAFAGCRGVRKEGVPPQVTAVALAGEVKIGA